MMTTTGSSMNDASFALQASGRRRRAGPTHAACAELPKPTWIDVEYLSLMRAYRSHGGIARMRELVDGAASRSELSRQTVESWLSNAEAFSFSWSNDCWIPLFQFDPATSRPLPPIQAICKELSPLFDGWSIARWFVEENSLLRHGKPIDLVAMNCDLVLQAARADHFIAKGFGA